MADFIGDESVLNGDTKSSQAPSVDGLSMSAQIALIHPTVKMIIAETRAAERNRIVALLRDPPDAFLAVPVRAATDFPTCIVRRNKARPHDQWEVVEVVDSDGPISEETLKLHGVYGSLLEARAVGDALDQVSFGRAVCAAIADCLATDRRETAPAPASNTDP